MKLLFALMFIASSPLFAMQDPLNTYKLPSEEFEEDMEQQEDESTFSMSHQDLFELTMPRERDNVHSIVTVSPDVKKHYQGHLLIKKNDPCKALAIAWKNASKDSLPLLLQGALHFASKNKCNEFKIYISRRNQSLFESHSALVRCQGSWLGASSSDDSCEATFKVPKGEK